MSSQNIPPATAVGVKPKFTYAESYIVGQRTTPAKQLLYQLMLLFIAFTVLFPILWVVSMSFDPRADVMRPTTLNLIPPGFSLKAYLDILEKPTSNPVSLPMLAINSLLLAGGSALASVMVGVFAAYAFSRFKFAGRQFLMLAILAVLILPNVATLAPLFVLLNRVVIGDFNLRNSLLGVGLALLSTLLPFSIWNLKGYIDTIPKELEEAALIDGASPNQTFFRIMLPLATPAIAITGFLGFMSGWTEFYLSWQFLTNPDNFTLAMALYNMTGQFASSTPWSHFSAMAVIIALPVSLVYLLLQKYMTGGLTIGGVKG
ncbi:MAG: carbohydrate ABC transporter permease [Chloroflexi bacterium]|nr:carbohydrate ABC transporter permease [Chloroflexota bacterium]